LQHLTDQKLKLIGFDWSIIELNKKREGGEIITAENVVKLSGNRTLKKYKFENGFYAGIYIDTPGSGYIDFDEDGKIASRGRVNKKLFEKLINNFPENIYPRADDLKVYTEYFFKNFESFKKLPPNDLFRTLTEVTAEMIFKFFVFCERPEKVIFHGGGTLNSFLMKRIQQKIEKKLHTTDDFGVPSKYVESAGFAYLAYKKRSEIFFPK